MRIEIYKITNLVNDKCYIGQTSKGTGIRFSQHCLSESVIGNAIRKYGKENFIIDTLYTVTNKEMADMLEEKCVERYHSHGKNGYNASNTGRGTWKIKEPINFMDNYITVSSSNVWCAGLSMIDKGRLFKLIRNTDKFTGKIKYGDNVQQYCRTWQDLSKVLNCSYNTLKQQFIKKIKDRNIMFLKNGILVFNEDFILRRHYES